MQVLKNKIYSRIQGKNEYMLKDKKDNVNKHILMRILTAVVVIYTIFLIVRIIGACFQTEAYPNEYREAANIAVCQSFLKGVNPYQLETVEQAVPSVCYLYGPVMSLIAAALAIVLPFCSLQLVHYLISFAAILLSAFLMTVMIFKRTNNNISSAIVFLMSIFCHWRYGYIFGAPDSFGLCVMICTLYMLDLCGENASSANVSNANVSAANGANTRAIIEIEKCIAAFAPEIAALLTVLTFFTKQYFLMVAAVGAGYLLFVSKKKFLRYVIAGIVISAVIFGLLYFFCPLYFTYAIYFLKGPGAGAAMGKTGIAYNKMQISYLGGMLLTLFISAFASVVYFAVALIKNSRIKFNIKSLEKPLIFFEDKATDTYVTDAGVGADNNKKTDSDDNSISRKFSKQLLFFIHALVAFLVLRYIGNNDGAFLSYYLQLFVPALILISVAGIELWNFERYNKGIYILCAVYVIFVSYTIYKVEPRLIVNKLSQEEMAQWEQAYELLDGALSNVSDSAAKAEYSEEIVDINGHLLRTDIYYVPPLNYHGYENDQYVYNDGQPFVLSKRFSEYYAKSALGQKFFPYAGQLIKQHLDYKEHIRQKVIAGEYELVTNIADMDTVFTEEELSIHYVKTETLMLRTGNWAWEVDFWVKNK